MAETQSITTLNIGSQTISIAQFARGKDGGVVMTNYGTSQILADPSAEATRLPQIRLAISELAQKLKISKQELRYAISGQSVFVRFIKLPPVGGDDVEQLVKFEAQQQVPFPIDEVTWDYHLLPDDGGEQEVAIVAIKSDALNEINDLVDESGIHSSSGVEVAPLALYNAFVHTYPNVSASTVLVDIGARTMNLIYIEGSKVFVRSIPGGGASLTTSIAKEFGISFAEAEAQKTQNGLIALGGGHTQTMDEGTAALASVLRNALNRIVSEIPRTTGFFRSQHGGSAPTRVILSGGTASLPYCKEFIEEKLRLPVEFFNPLVNINVTSKAESAGVAQHSHQTGELVGMALAAFGKARVDIELVPDAIEKERDTKRRMPIIMAGCAAAVIGAAVFAFGAFKGSQEIQAEADALAKRKADLDSQSGLARSLNTKAFQLDQILKQYDEAQNGRVRLVDLLGDFVARTKTDSLWVVDFDPIVGYDPTNAEVITGASYYIEKLGTLKYGESAVTTELPREEVVEKPRPGQRRTAVEEKNPVINAIRIKGLFLSDKGNKTVYAFVNKLAESPYFDLNDKDGNRLDQGLIVRSLNTEEDEDEFANPFTLVLPLKNPVEVPKIR